jgi:hypothetical protein
MTNLLRASLIFALIAVVPGLAVAADAQRHSGTVASVDPAARTLVLKELVENGRPRQLEIRVPAGTAVVDSVRLPDEQVTQLDAPFTNRTVDLGDVRPGDFVVVEGPARDGSVTASAVVVTLRANAAGAASPAMPSR